VEERIRSADTVVAVVSGEADNDLLQYELEIAMDERKKRGFPQILPVWLDKEATEGGPLEILSQNLLQAQGHSSDGGDQAISEVRAALSLGQSEKESQSLGTFGAADGREESLYVRRRCDDELDRAIEDRESIILIKGPRQIGKTSLIGRGQRTVERLNWRLACSDFQKLSTRQMESEEAFYRVLATTLTQQLGVPFDFDSEWPEVLGPNLNMDGLIRKLLEASPEPLVWFIDEADRIFASPFASEFYGLVRSWHNGRAMDRRGPWSRLTVVIGYATEAHLFIKDLHQSPFNVGLNIELEMFDMGNLIDLNERYGAPLSSADLHELHGLLGGHPYLTRRAFDALTRRKIGFDSLIESSASETGPFGDHLKRLLLSVSQLPPVMNALLRSLASPMLEDSDGLRRLVAAGVLVMKSPHRFELANDLYRRYLGSRLQG
jgi:hypothetical protein